MCAAVRTTRARIIWLKNDYKDLMSRIEKGLHEHHARLAAQAANDPTATQQSHQEHGAPSAVLEAPFAKVNSVVAGSPAETAGLRVGDTITKFGWVDWTNHERLSRVAEAVSQNEGVHGVLPTTRWRTLADGDTGAHYRQSIASKCFGRPRRDCRDATHPAKKLGWSRAPGLPLAALVSIA